MPSAEKIPLIILAGSAKRAEEVAEEHSHRLYGPKGLKIRLAGRPLIDVIIDRFHSSGEFEPIFVAGPAAHYGESRGPATVIDTDADFGHNIKASLDSVVERLSAGPTMFTTCDVIPKVAELEALVADYRSHAPVDFWFPLIRVPEDPQAIGATADKRRYMVVPEGETEPVVLLPSHMVLIDPTALRLTLIYKSFQLAYNSRTKTVLARFAYIITGVLRFLMWRDLRNLMRFRPPLLTLIVLVNAFLLSKRLDSGRITQEQVERHLHLIFANEPHRRRYRNRRGRVPILEGVSLARDIDTEEEAEELHVEIGR